MSGVRLGERVLQVGVDDARLVGQIAAKTGLSGEAACVVADAQQAAKAKSGGDQAGVLMDIAVVPRRHVAASRRRLRRRRGAQRIGMLASLDAPARRTLLRESARVLRPGGRIIVIEPGTRTGLRSLLKPVPPSQVAVRRGRRRAGATCGPPGSRRSAPLGTGRACGSPRVSSLAATPNNLDIR